jgi:protein TonB
MSLSGAISQGAGVGFPPAVAVRPGWLRPVALILILAIHAAIFFAVRGAPDVFSPLDAVDVTLVPLGDSAQDQRKVEEIPAAEPPPAPASPEPPPLERSSELAAPPPQVASPEAIPLAVSKPKPIARPRPKEDDRQTADERRKLREAAERRQEARDEARENALRKRAALAAQSRKAQQEQAATHRGAPGGAAAGAMSQASYAGLLAAELRRHTFYPAAAKAAGVSGSVGVTFTIGPSGRVISQSITRSSGNSALDSAAHAIMSAIHAPPPPGGRFNTSTNLRFGFR